MYKPISWNLLQYQQKIKFVNIPLVMVIIILHTDMAFVWIYNQTIEQRAISFSQSAFHSGPYWWPHGLGAGGGAGYLLWRLHPGRGHGRVWRPLRLHEISANPAGLGGWPHLPWWARIRWCLAPFYFLKNTLDNVFPPLNLFAHNHTILWYIITTPVRNVYFNKKM